jgi:hypothetical protein
MKEWRNDFDSFLALNCAFIIPFQFFEKYKARCMPKMIHDIQGS